MRKKYLLLVIMFLNAFCLVISGSIKTREVGYFKRYKEIKDKYPEGMVFDNIRKPQAFYHFTGYKTLPKGAQNAK